MPKDLIVSGRLRVGINAPAGADPEILSSQNILNLAGQNSVHAQFTNYENGGGFTQGFNFRLASARGTPAAPVALLNNDYIGEIESFVFNGVDFQETAEIKFLVDGAVVNGQNSPSRIEFWTNVLNAGPLLRVTITSQGLLLTQAVSATIAGFRLPHGTAPSSPVNGDLWTTSAGGLFGRINGVTQNYAPTASPTFTGTVNAAALTMTGQLQINTAAGLISNGTSDGADNATLELNGGGGAGTSRGARILLNGNEAGAFGDLELDAGVGGYINISTNGSKFAEWVDTGATRFLVNVATTAGGNILGIRLGTSQAVGVFFGSGVPTITAPKGSVYLRTDGTTTLTRMYVNTDSGTTWTGIVTVA